MLKRNINVGKAVVWAERKDEDGRGYEYEFINKGM